MTRDETIALWKECETARASGISNGKSTEASHEKAKEIWNTWARPLEEKRTALERAGLLRVASDQAEDVIAPRKRALNDETRQFLAQSVANFNGFRFTHIADFDGFIFPGDAYFGQVQPERNRDSNPAIFEQHARFNNCVFLGDAHFKRVEFLDHSGFSRMQCKSDVSFGGANFRNSAWFRGAYFFKDLWFGQANFASYCDFIGTIFHGTVSFRGLNSNGIFDLTGSVFSNSLPDFSQAAFKEAPGFDGVRYPTRSFWALGDRLEAPKYRALRRLAIQGHDHENEGAAFKGEIRSKRGTQHKPWHLAFWFGVIYDGISDYGRSMLRPLSIWLVSVFAFAAIYFWNANEQMSDWIGSCAGAEASKALRAINFSAANALPLIGSLRSEEAKAFYDCLSLPTVPAWSPMIQIGQTLWSAVLIFLFLLAVRNQFKIK